MTSTPEQTETAAKPDGRGRGHPAAPDHPASSPGAGEASSPGAGEASSPGAGEAASPGAVPAVVEAVLRFAAARRRPAAVFLLAEGNPADGTPDMPITRRTVSHLADAVGTDTQFEALDLVIQSSGGDVHAAYQMMSFLRAHMSENGELVSCVPRKAQSSATLLCLGGDRILLDELGTLGPLDAQIRVGLTDAGTPDYASALHLLKGLNRLQEFSLDTLTEAAGALYENRVRRNEDILRFAIEFSRGITAPLFERIESHRIGYWDQMLRTGEAYGRRLLRRGHLLREVPDVDRDELIDTVVHQLVFEYPSHEYVIDRPELERIHLKAEPFPPESTAAVRELAKFSSETLVMLVYPPGTSPPPELEDARTSSLRDWTLPSVTRDASTFRWEDSTGGRYFMRVGLYRGPLKASRNPWRDGSAGPSQVAPSEQFAVSGDSPSWGAPDLG
jgi:hypothetical protein